MANGRIFLSSPTMNGHEMEYINEAFETNWIAPLGKNVDEFEHEMARYVGAKYAAALNAGTAAIHLALMATGVARGDVVISSAFTFSATCNPITYQSATPVFVDSEADSWNMSPDAIRAAFAKYPNAKAVIVANLYGTPAKLDEIRAICDEHGATLIEDAAESLGATLNGRQTGTFGKYGVFSFNGNKIITTSGGGMLVSDDEERIAKVRFWATQARDKARHYQHSEIGYNYRMSNIVAGIGRGQLLTLDEYVERKRAIYEAYKAALEPSGVIKMNPYLENSRPNHWLSCMTLESGAAASPNDVMDALERENIESRPMWKPMQLQPVFAECDFFPNIVNGKSLSEDIFARGVCLPSDIKMSSEDISNVARIVLETVAR